MTFEWERAIEMETRFKDLVAEVPGALLSGDCDIPVRRIVFDSRAVGPGDLFVALRGQRADGHDHLGEVVAAGVAGVIAEVAPPGELRIAWAHVKDSRLALALASSRFYGMPTRELDVVGVTGTNGKTTTTFIIRHLFESAQRKCGLLGTVGVDVGDGWRAASHTTPEPVALQAMFAEMLTRGCRAAAMEVSSHALAQRRVDGVMFRAGVFTNLSQDHLDYHRDMEDYYAAKARLFELMAEMGQGGVAVINGDDRYGRRLMEKAARLGLEVVSYGRGLGCELRMGLPRPSLDGVQFPLEVRGRQLLVRLPLFGSYNMFNAAAALGAVGAFGLNLREGIRHLAECPQVPGRMESVAIGQAVRVLVDYAHTPDALRNALAAAREMAPGRVVVVFGAGGDRDRGKRAQMGRAADELADISILTSDNPRNEEPRAILAEIEQGFRTGKYHVEVDRRQAIALAVGNAEAGDVVLVAGKGHEDYQEFEGGHRVHFDDREVVRQVLRDMGRAS